MVKSPDERPFLAVFKLLLASANSMATPLYGKQISKLPLPTPTNNYPGSGHKFERTKVRIAEKVELLSARTFVLATTSDKFLYSVKCLSWPEYMYDVPLSPVYNSPHQVVRYQVTQSSVLLL